VGSSGLASVVGGALGLGMLVVGSVWHPIKTALDKIKKTFF
jgi:hypothetical protein